ncbi:uncharacterized protein LOC110987134 isoform X2 [Acanthaster planci]|uniref:Uncharacterized protein LOC110987134 isoform X2 n=1 Tax=Acanthaster planci TaxID=133434 RepID=A0A8B7ZI02_ACAPL|nr:uncharacterized protein LOC110987134 isoform X2 [Acanthaster planci]
MESHHSPTSPYSAERSRYAAKMRRDKEGVEIAALAKLLPYPEEITSRLDKGSIIRLITSYLRMKKFSQKEGNALLEELNQKAITAGEEPAKELAADWNDGTLMLQALNGFVIFISRKGKIFYISDNVGKHLGIHQYEMIGNSMMEFIHADDQKELAKQFVVQVPGQQTFKGYGMENVGDAPTSMSFNCFDTDKDEEMPSISDFIQERQFFLRMRSVMSRRGSGGKGKVIGYRVVNFCGRLKLTSSTSSTKGYVVEGLICLCRPIQPQPILEVRMDGNMFMSRHSLDMCFTFCDPRIITLIGYEPHELVGKTVYQFHNPLDARKVSDCHSNLIMKGTSATKYYRFMGKNGSWVWLQTRATIIYNTNNVAQYIVCMNYVIGKDVGERSLLMEEMAKSRGGNELCSSIVDSDCGDSIPSPSSDMASGYTPASVASSVTSGIGSGSDMDEPSLKPVKQEVDFDELIPKAVRDKEEIKKPAPEQDISFAALLKMDNLKRMYGATDKMDTAEKVDSVKKQESMSKGMTFAAPGTVNSDGISVNNIEGPFSNPLQHKSTEIQESFQRATQNPAVDVLLPMQTFSPVSEASSDSSSTAEVSSPPMAVALPSDGQDARMASVGEEDESLFKDLLELTKDDNMDNPSSQLNSELPRMSFSVNSPSNLSQLLNSQSAASISLGMSSPESQDLVDDCLEGDDEVFNGRPESTEPSSSILAGLLTKPRAQEPTGNGASGPSLDPPPSQGNLHYMNMSVTKVDPMMSGASSQLPDDIANFSLEFCQPVMDQAACDAITALGGDFFVPDPMDKGRNGATITEVTDIEDNGLLLNTSESEISAASNPLANLVNSPPKMPNGIVQTQVPLAQPHNISLDLHRNVTERISQLDIKDSGRALAPQINESANAPILHALLLESRANSQTAEKSRGQRPAPLSSNGLDSVSDVLGPITPCTKAAVDAVDSLIQDFDEMPGTNTADPVFARLNGNNNMVNQENYVLLQQMDQQRKHMAEEHRRQQQILMENQAKQQKQLEEQQRQLLQSQNLQGQSIEQALLRKQMQQKLQQQYQLQQQLQQQQLQQQHQLQQQQQTLLAQQAGMTSGLPRSAQGPELQGNSSVHGQGFDMTEFAAPQSRTVSAALPVSSHHRQQQQMQQYSASPPQSVMDSPLAQQQLQRQRGSPPVMGRSPPVGSPHTLPQQYPGQPQAIQQQQQPTNQGGYSGQMQQPSYCRQQQQSIGVMPEQANNNSLMWNNIDPMLSHPSMAMMNRQGRTMEQSDLDFGSANPHLLQHQ